MKPIFIYDSSFSDSISSYRGGGRIMQVLRENLPGATFTDNFAAIPKNAALLIPSWNPFSPPLINRRIGDNQYLMIFDVIPLKYPSHFPAGIRGNFNLWRNKQALKYFDKIITISNHSKKDIIQYLGVPEGKIEIVYPTVGKAFLDLKIENGKRKINPHISNFKFQISNSRYCLYVGDVNWNKNLVNLARAIKIANVTCIFVGKPFEKISNFKFQISNSHHPWQQEFREFLKEVGDDKRFIFLGYVEDQKLIQLYQRATCNILVSRDEGFGMSYLEAATQACPSILSDIPVFHEIAENSALFANPKDPNDIANKIIELYFDKKSRDTLGKKALKRRQLFSPSTFTEQFLKVVSA